MLSVFENFTAFQAKKMKNLKPEEGSLNIRRIKYTPLDLTCCVANSLKGEGDILVNWLRRRNSALDILKNT